MIPSTNSILSADLETEVQPTKNHKMHIEQSVVSGFCDELEAMKQVIYKILNSERYQYIIYSWDYGIELLDLYGEPITYVCPELERRIKEALVQDDRIDDVTDFKFDLIEKRTIKVTFTVHTIYGGTQVEKVVNF